MKQSFTQLGLQPTRDTGDGGHDGVGHFMMWTPRGMERTEARVLAEVKTGKPTLTQVRSFCHVMERNEAQVGIFITIEPITAGMRQEATSMGTFNHNGLRYPRFQFWQIDDAYFENPETINAVLRLPDEWRVQSARKSARHFGDKQTELAL